jgi:hypothetical protein
MGLRFMARLTPGFKPHQVRNAAGGLSGFQTLIPDSQPSEIGPHTANLLGIIRPSTYDEKASVAAMLVSS